MKESYLKALGRGLLDEPAGIEMIAPGGEPCRFFNGWCLAASDAFPGYSLAWCGKPDERECEIVAVSPREMA